MPVSAVAQLNDVAPSLLFPRTRMSEGGYEAVRTDREVVSGSRFGQLEAKVQELERLLGRKDIKTEMLREIWNMHAQKARPARLAGLMR